MKYLSLEKSLLTDYRNSHSKEFITVNRHGAYSSSTLPLCNSRKYHALFVVPASNRDLENLALLSCLDETIEQKEHNFELGAHQYPGTIHPQGFQYLQQFTYSPALKWLYKAGDIELSKSLVMSRDQNQLLISYEIIDAEGAFKMRLQPFLAFRGIHSLQHARIELNKKFELLPNGAQFQPYDSLPPLCLQSSRKAHFIPAPYWYYNIQYTEEQARGYDFAEDLYAPGYFEISLKKGDHAIISVTTQPVETRKIKRYYTNALNSQSEISNFKQCLEKAAGQFIIQQDEQTKIVAGWHWFGSWGRDTFISLPGLTLSTDKPDLAASILDTAQPQLKDGLFPNCASAHFRDYNSVDAPLWFCWAAQQYAAYIGNSAEVWGRYGAAVKNILHHYKEGTQFQIKMMESGLISCGGPDVALTWMDAVIAGKPVTPRTGMPVEINALWYNAVCFALEAAGIAGDNDFTAKWKDLAPIIEANFVDTYWDEEKGFLADCVHGEHKDWSLRPNQIIATSLPYSPLNMHLTLAVVTIVQNELLTPRGLRTLATHEPEYTGTYGGDQAQRDRAYHQGTVWPWLIGHFAEGYLKVHEHEGRSFIQSLLDGFEPTLSQHGIGTISEIFDGDEPHLPRGAIAQAWSVAELLRTGQLIGKYNPKKRIEQRLEKPVTSNNST